MNKLKLIVALKTNLKKQNLNLEEDLIQQIEDFGLENIILEIKEIAKYINKLEDKQERIIETKV